MASSDRLFGFSSGAIAKRDFRAAISVLREAGVRAIELSALREGELPELSKCLCELDLAGFAYVSVHAPTAFHDLSEREVIRLLRPALDRRLPVVVHPDTITSPGLWQDLASILLIENMDKRKPRGRTPRELAEFFTFLPHAGLCFDIAHARQVDPTMSNAAEILREFGHRIRQIHASEVRTDSSHGRLSAAASWAISRVSHLIPPDTPIILESPVDKNSISSEIEFAETAFSPWLVRLRADIDDVFDVRIPSLRHDQVENFLKDLEYSRTKLTDFENVVIRLPSGGAYKPGDLFLTSRDLFARLSPGQKDELREYLFARIQRISSEFPDLRRRFPNEFAGIP